MAFTDLREEIESMFSVFEGQTSGLAHAGGFHVCRSEESPAEHVARTQCWRRRNPQAYRDGMKRRNDARPRVGHAPVVANSEAAKDRKRAYEASPEGQAARERANAKTNADPVKLAAKRKATADWKARSRPSR